MTSFPRSWRRDGAYGVDDLDAGQDWRLVPSTAAVFSGVGIYDIDTGLLGDPRFWSNVGSVLPDAL
jgi:hypothetical protein